MKLAAALLILFSSIAWAEQKADPLAEFKAESVSVESTSLHSDTTILVPTLELGNTAAAIGVSFGRLETMVSTRRGITEIEARAPQIRALGIYQDLKFRGGMAFGAFHIGGQSWKWWPASVELAIGMAAGEGTTPFGVLSAGYFVGVASGLQGGFVVYTPLATSEKPHWFQDGMLSLRYPFNLTAPARELVKTTVVTTPL